MDKTWKAVERKVAAFLGGERVPVSGRQRGYAPDVEHPLWSIEVKHRSDMPKWIFDAMRQAEASRRGEQIPIAIFHLKGMAIAESLTVMRISDTLALQQRIAELERQVEILKSNGGYNR